ncbi:MAG: AAA family ATPase [Bacteroidales bacterium]
MIVKTNHSWPEENKHYLMLSLKILQEEIEHYLSKKEIKQEIGTTLRNELKDFAKNMTAPSSIDTITSIFNLSSFERKILLMCAGVELDSGFASFISSIQGSQGQFLPTFSLALAVFPEAQWSALSPDNPLRYWRLIEVDTNHLLTKSPLRINERVLHYLAGIQYVDESLSGYIEPFIDLEKPVSSHKSLASRIVQACTSANSKSTFPIIRLNGNDLTDNLGIASHVCSQLSLSLYLMPARIIPENIKDMMELLRSWNRESVLGGNALLIDCHETDKSDSAHSHVISTFCKNIQSVTFISSRQWSPDINRPVLVFEVNKPTADEQLMLWRESLNSHAIKMDGHLQKLISHFNMSPLTIRKAGNEIRQLISESSKKDSFSQDKIENILWKTSCKFTSPRLNDLAQHIPCLANWDDLILPESQKTTLREIAMHVRHQHKVYESWGFASKSSRGLGISALFAGDSGTGKTMASEVLANELQLDLYRIDLSQVVNKYIGETEKNLKKIFDAAEEGGAILLFDEADALFGKRSEVKDSHDRYANIEVSYLLQRMEAYRGLAILTTNLKSSLDKAFLRRIRFIVQFPFPDAILRAEIWRRIFPKETPTENLDIKNLAKLSITGGNIRNIALNAAFIAANKDQPIRMAHISRAAKNEYTKLEKPMSTLETGTW